MDQQGYRRVESNPPGRHAWAVRGTDEREGTCAVAESPHTDLDVGAPSGRLLSPGGAAWASLLGGFIGGGVVLAVNYWKWDRKTAAATAVGTAALVTVVTGFLTYPLPIWTSLVETALTTVLGFLIAKGLQGRRIATHLAAGGRKMSNWVGAGIGLAALLVTVVVIIVGAIALVLVDEEFASGSSVSSPSAIEQSVPIEEAVYMGDDQYVFYSDGATREDARAFGETLIDFGYFDGSGPADVTISGPPDARELSFYLAEGGWDDEPFVQWIRAISQHIATETGTPLRMRLLDEYGDEKSQLQIESEPRWLA